MIKNKLKENKRRILCNNKKLSMSIAKNIISFDLNIDPFYSEENYKRLSKAIEDAKAGRNMKEHELINN